MLLDGVLSQAASGLNSITKQLSVLSQNVANASTPGYVRESVGLSSATAGGDGLGVRSGVAMRVVDQALQDSVLAAGGQVAGGQVLKGALTAIDAASGTPGSGQDLPGLIGALRDAFSTLGNDPSNGTQQREVVDRAAALAGGVNGLGQAVSAERQAAQDGLRDDVAQANTALGAVGTLSRQIIAARQRGESTADLEDQRDVAMGTVARLTGAKFLPQPNGDVLAVSGGTVLPLHDATGPLSLGSATLAPGSTAPPVLLNGAPALLPGGQIGARLQLRDVTLAGFQAGLDGFADGLAAGFMSAGLSLFTGPGGAVPAPGTAGFAQSVRVSPVVQSTPSQVRDGAGPPGQAGSTALINTILNTALATGAGTLAGRAADLVAGTALQLTMVTRQVDTEVAVQGSLRTKLDAGTGVTVDTELAHMVQLQNAYGANAKVIAAVQAMFAQLSASVQ